VVGRGGVGSLSSAHRQRNIAGGVNITKSVARVVVDDIVTVGATAGESVRVLHIAGAHVAGLVAIAKA
jgi:predicted amidophosphoribosyltransferase